MRAQSPKNTDGSDLAFWRCAN